jgi:carboxymethylenebutenolidase
MGFTKQWVSYGDDNAYTGYFAAPAGPTLPLASVLVVQELFGVNGHIQNVTERFAAAGYAALAPDLYAHHGKRQAVLAAARVEEVQTFADSLPDAAVAFGPRDALEAHWGERPVDVRMRIGETIDAMRQGMHTQMPAWLAHLRAALQHVNTELPMTEGQKVGCVGYCMGGTLAAQLAACADELAAVAVYYGRPPDIEDIPQIQCPMLVFNGAQDTALMQMWPDFEAGMRKAGKHYAGHTYPNARHAFFNDSRPTYNVLASRDAYARTLMHFNTHL